MSRISPCGMEVHWKQFVTHKAVCTACQEICAERQRQRLLKLNGKIGIEMVCGVSVPRRSVGKHKIVCGVCGIQKRTNIQERMNKHNTRPEQKAAASKAARKTSARRDIQLQRAAKLKVWQDSHPEELKKNIEAAQKEAGKRSRNEVGLRKMLGWEDAQIVCGTERKQIDFISPDGKIWIEVDGYWHFFSHKNVKDQRPSRKIDRLPIVQARDAMLNVEARKRGVTLIRLAGACFWTSSGRLKDECQEWLTAMLQSPIPGVYCVGALYDTVPWASEGCTILKLTTQNTTSSCLME